MTRHFCNFLNHNHWFQNRQSIEYRSKLLQTRVCVIIGVNLCKDCLTDGIIHTTNLLQISPLRAQYHRMYGKRVGQSIDDWYKTLLQVYEGEAEQQYEDRIRGLKEVFPRAADWAHVDYSDLQGHYVWKAPNKKGGQVRSIYTVTFCTTIQSFSYIAFHRIRTRVTFRDSMLTTYLNWRKLSSANSAIVVYNILRTYIFHIVKFELPALPYRLNLKHIF